jgi:hypothetical protein
MEEKTEISLWDMHCQFDESGFALTDSNPKNRSPDENRNFTATSHIQPDSNPNKKKSKIKSIFCIRSSSSGWMGATRIRTATYGGRDEAGSSNRRARAWRPWTEEELKGRSKKNHVNQNVWGWLRISKEASLKVCSSEYAWRVPP